jgi:hypothetical protein
MVDGNSIVVGYYSRAISGSELLVVLITSSTTTCQVFPARNKIELLLFLVLQLTDLVSYE